MYVYPPLLCMLHLYNILNYKYLICFANRQIPTYNGQFNQKATSRYCLSILGAYCPLTRLCFRVRFRRMIKIKGGYHDMNVNINVDYEPLTYLETIPASCLHLPYPKNLDSDHEVYHTSPRLKGGATLHRFRNAAGVEYSAIYVGRVEQKSAQREREFIIIIDWYLYCL